MQRPEDSLKGVATSLSNAFGNVIVDTDEQLKTDHAHVFERPRRQATQRFCGDTPASSPRRHDVHEFSRPGFEVDVRGYSDTKELVPMGINDCEVVPDSVVLALPVEPCS